MQRLSAIFVLFVFLVHTPAAHAALLECEARFDNLTDAVVTAQSGGYDPFASSDAIQAFPINIKVTSGLLCPMYVTFKSESGNARYMRSGSNMLEYKLQQTASGSEFNNSDAPRSNGVLSFIARLLNIPLEYYVRIPSAQVVPGGTYTSSVTLTLYLDGAKPKVLDERTISVRTNVREITQVTLGNTQSSGTTSAVLNFVNVKTGDSRNISVFVQSATNYKLNLRSQNGEVLLNTEDDNWKIEYSAYFNGKRLKLERGKEVTAVPNGKAAKGATADSYDLSFTIGTVTEQRAGTYEDIIYLTMEPKP